VIRIKPFIGAGNNSNILQGVARNHQLVRLEGARHVPEILLMRETDTKIFMATTNDTSWRD